MNTEAITYMLGDQLMGLQTDLSINKKERSSRHPVFTHLVLLELQTSVLMAATSRVWEFSLRMEPAILTTCWLRRDAAYSWGSPVTLLDHFTFWLRLFLLRRDGFPNHSRGPKQTIKTWLNKVNIRRGQFPVTVRALASLITRRRFFVFSVHAAMDVVCRLLVHVVFSLCCFMSQVVAALSRAWFWSV